MEELRVRVRSVEVKPAARLAVARVEAKTVRKVNGRPAARIDLKVTFRVAQGETGGVLQERALDEALACLGVP